MIFRVPHHRTPFENLLERLLLTKQPLCSRSFQLKFLSFTFCMLNVTSTLDSNFPTIPATPTIEALDALAIEDKKRQYAAVENYLEDVLHSALATSDSFLPSLSDLGLNIREAHVFSTTDGYSLDVFVVDGWSVEGEKGITDLKSALQVNIRQRFFLHKVEKDLAAVTD